MTRTPILLSLLATGAITLAACGSSTATTKTAVAPAAAPATTTAMTEAMKPAATTAMTEAMKPAETTAMTEAMKPAASTAMTEAMTDVKLSAAYCAKATALGSLSKGATAAMAMRSAGAAMASKDFKDIADKLDALKAEAPDSLKADIDALHSMTMVESMAEAHMKADGTGAEAEAMQMKDAKAMDDKAMSHLVTATKAGCNVDLT
jgi:hypothetical protein